MRNMITAAVLLALVAIGCGDDDTGPSPTAATTTAATTATTEATTTTMAATTTTADAGAERAAAAAAVAGTYRGDWNNTTFGSTGAIEATLDIDVDARLGILRLDLGGFVFGGSDPDPLTVEFDLTVAGPYPGSTELFGAFTMDFVAGRLTIVAPAVPGVGGREMIIEGDLADGAFTGTYTITGLADGVFTATREG